MEDWLHLQPLVWDQISILEIHPSCDGGRNADTPQGAVAPLLLARLLVPLTLWMLLLLLSFSQPIKLQCSAVAPAAAAAAAAWPLPPKLFAQKNRCSCDNSERWQLGDFQNST